MKQYVVTLALLVGTSQLWAMDKVAGRSEAEKKVAKIDGRAEIEKWLNTKMGAVVLVSSKERNIRIYGVALGDGGTLMAWRKESGQYRVSGPGIASRNCQQCLVFNYLESIYFQEERQSISEQLKSFPRLIPKTKLSREDADEQPGQQGE